MFTSGILVPADGTETRRRVNYTRIIVD